jgi:hypothetical protein
MKFGATSDGNVIANVKMYEQMVGKFIYLTITRPDIAFSVGIVLIDCFLAMGRPVKLAKLVSTSCYRGLAVLDKG